MHRLTSPLAFFPLLFLLSLPAALAHCPLCTVGAAAAAGGAAWLGVSSVVIGLFIGAFAVSMGWWFGRLIKKKVVPFQTPLLIVASFLLTILPMLPLLPQFRPLYVSLVGDEGSPLNRLYLLNLFVAGSLLGGLVVSLAPWMSRTVTRLRAGRMIPFQGTLLTLSLLVVLGVILQVTVK